MDEERRPPWVLRRPLPFGEPGQRAPGGRAGHAIARQRTFDPADRRTIADAGGRCTPTLRSAPSPGPPRAHGLIRRVPSCQCRLRDVTKGSPERGTADTAPGASARGEAFLLE